MDTSIITVKLNLKIGQVKPDSYLGSCLGSKGINVVEFCNSFNLINSDKTGTLVPVLVHINTDKSFKIIIKKPTVINYLKEFLGIEKFPSTKNTLTISKTMVSKIAKLKLSDLNTPSLKKAKKTIIGCAKSAGIKYIG
ncbi:50S ribosomal protein L11 [Candidatus Vidania fulgoroideae]|uniref:Large ribosomal subunit protein uL11 n=1 Tax=Candidatus Vidania fulgoroideorum TaxID=881286 RepID=A0A974XE55_9PROT|nr:50S ribosomal protein L11 [Candidatus Vidania fulgoroideae]